MERRRHAVRRVSQLGRLLERLRADLARVPPELADRRIGRLSNRAVLHQRRQQRGLPAQLGHGRGLLVREQRAVRPARRRRESRRQRQRRPLSPAKLARGARDVVELALRPPDHREQELGDLRSGELESHREVHADDGRPRDEGRPHQHHALDGQRQRRGAGAESVRRQRRQSRRLRFECDHGRAPRRQHGGAARTRRPRGEQVLRHADHGRCRAPPTRP